MLRLESRDQGLQHLLTEEEEYEEEDDDEREELHEWDNVSTRTIFSARPEFQEAFQTYGSRTAITKANLCLLSKGDHIGWHRPWLIWHHAIVSHVDERNGMLKVIHYNKVDGETAIREQWIDVEEEWGDLFRFDYTPEITDENPPHVVLARARFRIGEKGYRFFRNNCEHFATFCKTGTKASAQVHWAWGKLKEAWRTSKVFLAKELGKQTIKSIAESTGKVAAAEIVEFICRATNVVGAGLVAALEVAHCGYDIYQMHKNKKEEKISVRDFNVSATQRVSEAVFGGGFAIGGSILCSFIPVVGPFIGSVVGGAVGSVVGKVIGSVVGGWIGKLF